MLLKNYVSKYFFSITFIIMSKKDRPLVESINSSKHDLTCN